MRYVIMTDSQSGKDQVRDLVSRLDSSKAWEVTILPYRKKKTEDQLAYYHGVVKKAFCDATGNDSQTVHDYLCGEYFGWDTSTVLDTVVHKPVRTLTYPSEINRSDMSDFISWCIANAAQHGIIIPDPREVIL